MKQVSLAGGGTVAANRPAAGKPFAAAVLAALTLFGPAALGTGLALSTVSPAQAQNLFAPRLYVNGEAITEYEVQQRAMFLRVLNAPGDLEKEALKTLTDERLQKAEAKRFGLKLTEQEVTAGMEDFASRANLTAEQLLGELQKIGVAPETYRDFISAGVMWRTIVRGKFGGRVTVSEAEVDRALEASVRPRALKVRLSELVIPLEPGKEEAAIALANRLAADIDSEAEFAAAARSYSAAPTAADGGRLPEWLPLANLPPAISGQIVGLAPGRASAPVVVPNAVVLFQLRGIAPDERAAPVAVTVEWAEYLVPNDAAVVANVRAKADECNDLYGLNLGGDPALLTVKKAALTAVPKDIALELAKLDQGEMSTTLTSGGNRRLVMLCSRQATTEEEPNRNQIKEQLMNQKLEGYARGFLEELRFAALIREP